MEARIRLTAASGATYPSVRASTCTVRSAVISIWAPSPRRTCIIFVTSARRGTFRKVQSSSVINAETKSFNTAFLAPETKTVPLRPLPPCITIRSNHASPQMRAAARALVMLHTEQLHFELKPDAETAFHLLPHAIDQTEDIVRGGSA